MPIRYIGEVASPVLLLALTLASWMLQNSPTTASLRGLAVVSSRVVWASGTGGTWLRTADGGVHWFSGTVPEAKSLDFRDIEAWDASNAVLLSSGEGTQSRVYGTSDGGEHWISLFTNPDPKGFFDALSFWDRQHGILLGDPVDGHFVVLTTGDGGRTWQRQSTPPALAGEGAFAASGTCLAVYGQADAWFGTGGGASARVFHSADQGKTWTVATTPLAARVPAAGIFSLAFRDRMHGYAAGGDYKLPKQTAGTLAITDDGGKTWNPPRGAGLSGYRSALAAVPGKSRILVAVGAEGSDFSMDGGKTWRAISASGLNAVAAVADGSIWAVGAHGVIARLKLP